ncbi:hypothetical protein M408DRAFT_328933 [Serendipita vermifera MAFF 305830]|uniref:Uncharacterized protein n=1 Tax=Serendipita vermifera MAFF 305830 TaxID=933852 RepID=A0A0C3BAX9_SERVB|nr:hypothetical protein M408DRAFT_328933 [Serendipita vermifera MAFF 305830]
MFQEDDRVGPVSLPRGRPNRTRKWQPRTYYQYTAAFAVSWTHQMASKVCTTCVAPSITVSLSPYASAALTT